MNMAILEGPFNIAGNVADYSWEAQFLSFGPVGSKTGSNSPAFGADFSLAGKLFSICANFTDFSHGFQRISEQLLQASSLQRLVQGSKEIFS